MFEDNLQRSMFNQNSEKTFIDKILAKQDADRIRELIKKDRLARADLIELLYLLSGVESKLLNYGAWDRYVILKFFVWIRDFCKVAELLYDYQEYIEKSDMNLSERAKKLFENCQRLIEHNAKFLIDLYLNIGRSTLSLGATGFLEILKNKFEIDYPHMSNLSTPLGEEKRGLLSLKRGKKND